MTAPNASNCEPLKALNPAAQQMRASVKFQRRFLNVGHEDYWPAGIEQGAFGNLFFARPWFEQGLADNCEIEAPRDSAELGTGAGEARGERARLGRDAGSRSRLGKPVDCDFRRDFIVAPHGIYYFDGNVAYARDDRVAGIVVRARVINERDSGEVCFERASHGDCVVSGGTFPFADAQIDDDVPDHGSADIRLVVTQGQFLAV